MGNAVSTAQPTSFRSLPVEIRLSIYEMVLVVHDPLPFGLPSLRIPSEIQAGWNVMKCAASTSQIASESREVFFGRNTFLISGFGFLDTGYLNKGLWGECLYYHRNIIVTGLGEWEIHLIRSNLSLMPRLKAFFPNLAYLRIELECLGLGNEFSDDDDSDEDDDEEESALVVEARTLALESRAKTIYINGNRFDSMLEYGFAPSPKPRLEVQLIEYDEETSSDEETERDKKPGDERVGCMRGVKTRLWMYEEGENKIVRVRSKAPAGVSSVEDHQLAAEMDQDGKFVRLLEV